MAILQSQQTILIEKRGFEFDKDSAVIKNDRLKAIYFKGEFGGFAIHLVQK